MLSHATITVQKSWLLPSKSSSKAEWPNPGLSIGRECRSLGRYKCWEVAGPAQTVSDCILSKVKVLLQSRNEYLNEKEPVPVALILGFYMVGRSAKKCNPTLLFTCEKRVPRRKAMNVVMENGLLASYPGVLLAESARSPLALQPAVSLGLARPAPENPEDEFKIYHVEPRSLSEGPRGMLIHVEGAKDGLLGSRIATIGGLVYSENEDLEQTFYGVTVAHAFAPSAGDYLISPSDVDEADSDGFAFYGEENDDNEEEDEAFVDMTSTGPSSMLNTSKVGKLYASSEDGPLASLDWAMIEIHPDFQKLNQIMRLFPSRVRKMQLVETRVKTCTGTSGMLTGILSGNMTLLKLPGSQTLQEVWVVRFDGNLNEGDCGSWVFDMETAELYGHIIAGHLNSGIGYIVPAFDIFQDIQKQIGSNLDLVQAPLELASKSEESIAKGRQQSLYPGAEENYGEFDLIYKCGWNKCLKAYTSLSRLNAHIARESHGTERSLDEYTEILGQKELGKEEKHFRQQAQGDNSTTDASIVSQADNSESYAERVQDPLSTEQQIRISTVSPKLQDLTRRIRKEVVKQLKQAGTEELDRSLDLKNDRLNYKSTTYNRSNDDDLPSLLIRPGSAPIAPKPSRTPSRSVPTPPRSAPRLDTGTRYMNIPNPRSLNALQSARRGFTLEILSAQFIDSQEQVGTTGGSNLRSAAHRSLPRTETSNADFQLGRLFDQNCNPTPSLGPFLRGLANYITREFQPKSGFVVTPEKMAAFYLHYSVENEEYPLFTIFKSQSHNILSELFQKLNCEHFLAQEDPSMQPAIPALSPAGFEQWMTIWILAYPDQEVRRLKKVVATLPIDADGEAIDGKAERLPAQLLRDLLSNGEDSYTRRILNEAISNALDNLDMSKKRKPSITTLQTSKTLQSNIHTTLFQPNSLSVTNFSSSVEIPRHQTSGLQAYTQAGNRGEPNPPSEILNVENLPSDISEAELKAMFSDLPGYKRLGFYEGSTCLVHFEDITDAENARRGVYNFFRANHVKYSNVHISFVKNTLSLKSTQRRGSSKS